MSKGGYDRQPYRDAKLKVVRDVVLVTLTKGHVAVVDVGDWELVRAYSWHAVPARSGGVYAAAGRRGPNNKTVGILQLHRYILGLEDPQVRVDHINGDPLDNRRCNLRTCTPSQNAGNSGPRTSNSSGVVGVDLHNGVWRARLAGRTLGYFKTKERAQAARKQAEEEYYGEFAWRSKASVE